MEEVLYPQRSMYCPISVSDVTTATARLRQSSLQEFSHAKNAAYRAFCRAPGRPQTAAFGRVYYEQRTGRPSSSRVSLNDCVVASKAVIEHREDGRIDPALPVNVHQVKTPDRVSRGVGPEHRLLSRARSARRVLRRAATEESNVSEKSEQSSPLTIEHSFSTGEDNNNNNSEDDQNDKHAVSTSSTADERSSNSDDIFASEEPEDCPKSLQEPIVTTTEVIQPVTANKQLVVYHFVDSGCTCNNGHCTITANWQWQPRNCSCEKRFSVSDYSVELQGDGHLSTPGLGGYGSQENKSLLDLLRKQLSLNGQQMNQDDKRLNQYLESLNTLVSRLVNVKAPTGFLYYFAYGPEMDTKRFMTYVGREVEETAWALLYGFKLIESNQRWESHWPKFEYCPQSAVEGRVYLITRQEAVVLDERLGGKQGFLTVLLPVWVMDSDENSCSTSQHCLPALIHAVPHVWMD